MPAKTVSPGPSELQQEQLILQERQTKALEKIAVSLDALTLWFEDIDRDEWSDRIQFYLAKWLELQENK